ncbi:MAG: GNAT family N-acetyltransferase [Methylocystaceae bacterium]|nr:GNAT family N-acetyltransferase [Methylocystaceae bacterium]
MSSQLFYKEGFLDLSGYSLVRADIDERWDNFVHNSPQGTLFSTSIFLSCLMHNKPGTWYCKKKGEIVAAVCVVESPDGSQAVEDDLIIYGGILFKKDRPNQNVAQTMSEHFRISAFLADELQRLYETVFINLSPNIEDLRPFLWYNYGNDNPKWQHDLRYTSYHDLSLIDPNGPLEKNPIYISASQSRRQQIKYGIKKGVITELSTDVERFLELYKLTFDRQDENAIGLMEETLRTVMFAILNAGIGVMYFSYTADGRLGSAAVFAWDNKRAYYLYGANDPTCRDDHTGTMILWQAFLDLAERGLPSVDMEGVNSPLRGHFKLSFGGHLVPYYHITFLNDRIKP